MKKTLLLTLTILLTLSSTGYSQISEDNLWSLKSALRDPYHPAITVNYMLGGGDSKSNLSYTSYRISADATLFGSTKLWGSIPINTQNGPLGSITGIGDLMLTVEQKFLDIAGIGVSGEISTKFATGSTTSGDSLPLGYQSGTGTNDLLLGVNLGGKNINLGIGYQFIGGRSANELTQLKQGDRFVVHAGYMYRGDKLDFGGDVVATQPLDKASVLNPIAQGEEFIDVLGSDKLQMNLILKGRYKLNESLAFTASLAFPVISNSESLYLARTTSAALGLALSF